MAVTITLISPGRGRPGDTVRLTGTGFSTTVGHNAVEVDGVVVPGASVTPVSTTALDVVIPAGIAANQHVLVEVENREDNTLATRFWWSKLSESLLDTTRVPAKQPGFREISGGAGIENRFLVEGRDFDRVAAKAELSPDELLTSIGRLSPRGPSSGLRTLSTAPSFSRYVRTTTGGVHRPLNTPSISWGVRIPAATLIEVFACANAQADVAGLETKQLAPDGGILSLLSVYVAPGSSGASSRITRLRVLVNGVEEFDTDDLADVFEQPFVNRGNVYTVSPGITVSAADRVQVGLTKNNATNTLDLLVSATIVA